ncbi:Phospholipid-transporting ATPase [Hondaea fermentalgiana]|uniref:Phospholipid-transporting ATPase n=1 Tax=Hondaea fermentalgiana TaxID=2315210 RepID=A0A2R5GUK9_9STRA|nr:Phospholipid-transporting ATPase [Hondaea fermentalgiana]|eukprot:GBG34009.1 Phospholipid-transporting ATPase [Hondaea fermentalgiana]
MIERSHEAVQDASAQAKGETPAAGEVGREHSKDSSAHPKEEQKDHMRESMASMGHWSQPSLAMHESRPRRQGIFNRLCAWCINGNAPEPEALELDLPVSLADKNARPCNSIQTARYTLLNFFFKCGAEQFRNLSNVYFLAIVVLALLGTNTDLFKSPYSAGGTLLGLVLVITFTMAFEGYYDVKRHREDKEINNRSTFRLRPGDGHLEEIPWSEVRPGDLLKVYDRSQFPADLLFATSPAAGHKCYVETANIDGETNLKIKHVAKDLVDRCMLPDQAASLNAHLRYDMPNSLLTFSGQIRVFDDKYTMERTPEGYKDIPLDTSNLLLRGSVLRNTPWVLGFVLYAGPETKVVQSSSNPPTKMSRLQKLINKIIILILMVDLVMCTVSSMVEIFGYPSNTEFYYLMQTTDNAFRMPRYVANVCTFIVLYSSLLPISLLFATTFSNFWQAMFIHWDSDMYHEETNTPAKCNTMELVQELGQVSYVFSDKTGTLTRNEMKLVGCAVDGEAYGVGSSEADAEVSSGSKMREIFASAMTAMRNPADPRAANLMEFWRVLAVCHTVLVDTTTGSIQYNAEGPDEEALVGAAAEVGMRLLSTDSGVYRVSVETRDDVDPEDPDTVETYEVLATNHFNSTRKRMSVIVRDAEGNHVLYVKGADTIMFDIAREPRSARESEDREQLTAHLDAFANDGLRTLVMARKTLSSTEFAAWKAHFDEANNALGEQRAELLDAAAALIERDLEIVGASAIEDRLQDGVPETLVSLREAGVKTWVLTGDKVETAINIAFSARLFSPEMDLIKITSTDPQENLQTLQELGRLLVPENLCKDSEHRRRGREAATASKREIFRGTSMHVGRTMVEKARRAARSVFNTHNDDTNSDAGASPKGPRFRFGRNASSRARFHSDDATTNSGDHLEMSVSEEIGRTRSRSLHSPGSTSTSMWSRIAHSRSMRGASNRFGAGSHTSGAADQDSFAVHSSRESRTDEAGMSSLVDTWVPTETEGDNDTDSQGSRPSHRRGTSEWRRAADILPPGVAEDDVIATNEQELEGTEANLDGFEAKNMALVISGTALRGLLREELGTAETEAVLLSLAKLCSVVVACRVSPKQKALVVRMVKQGVKVNGSSPVTLAIGDGANDVAMIQEARVGVGISGHEGRQAVNSSDFAIAQFRFLKDLMLVHGRWNYRRSASMVLFVFYSSVLFVLTAAIFNFFNKFSGSSSFPTFLTTVFSYPTQVPITVIACLNKDISRRTALEYPAMYISGRKNLHMDRVKALEYIFKSFLHAFFICAITMVWAGPADVDILTLGTTTYIATIWVCVARTCLETYTWTWLTVAIILFGFFSMFVFEPIYYGLDSSIFVMYAPTVIWGYSMGGDSDGKTFGQPPIYMWKCVFLIVVVCIGFDIVVMYAQREFYPSLVDIVIEIDRGYGDGFDNKKSRLQRVNKIFRKIAQPLLIPQAAITELLASGNIKNIGRAANRSAFDYDHPEDERMLHLLRFLKGMTSHHKPLVKDGEHGISMTVAAPSIVPAVKSPKVEGIDINHSPSSSHSSESVDTAPREVELSVARASRATSSATLDTATDTESVDGDNTDVRITLEH